MSRRQTTTVDAEPRDRCCGAISALRLHGMQILSFHSQASSIRPPNSDLRLHPPTPSHLCSLFSFWFPATVRSTNPDPQVYAHSQNYLTDARRATSNQSPSSGDHPESSCNSQSNLAFIYSYAIQSLLCISAQPIRFQLILDLYPVFMAPFRLFIMPTFHLQACCEISLARTRETSTRLFSIVFIFLYVIAQPGRDVFTRSSFSHTQLGYLRVALGLEVYLVCRLCSYNTSPAILISVRFFSLFAFALFYFYFSLRITTFPFI